jgi:hypothetical protein
MGEESEQRLSSPAARLRSRRDLGLRVRQVAGPSAEEHRPQHTWSHDRLWWVNQPGCTQERVGERGIPHRGSAQPRHVDVGQAAAEITDAIRKLPPNTTVAILGAGGDIPVGHAGGDGPGAATFAYAGILIGPAVVCWIAQGVGLTWTFAALIPFMPVTALSAGITKERHAGAQPSVSRALLRRVPTRRTSGYTDEGALELAKERRVAEAQVAHLLMGKDNHDLVARNKSAVHPRWLRNGSDEPHYSGIKVDSECDGHVHSVRTPNPAAISSLTRRQSQSLPMKRGPANRRAEAPIPETLRLDVRPNALRATLAQHEVVFNPAVEYLDTVG